MHCHFCLWVLTQLFSKQNIGGGWGGKFSLCQPFFAQKWFLLRWFWKDWWMFLAELSPYMLRFNLISLPHTMIITYFSVSKRARNFEKQPPTPHFLFVSNPFWIFISLCLKLLRSNVWAIMVTNYFENKRGKMQISKPAGGRTGHEHVLVFLEGGQAGVLSFVAPFFAPPPLPTFSSSFLPHWHHHGHKFKHVQPLMNINLILVLVNLPR